MQYNFQIAALDPAETNTYFEMTDSELAAINARRMTVDNKPGFPCRVSLQDAEIGEEVILFNYQHHKVRSPYRAAGAVFARRNARAAQLAVNELPDHLEHRLLSLRGYNREAMLVDARTVKGDLLEMTLQSMLDQMELEYVQIHNSAQGCFHCQVNRVP